MESYNYKKTKDKKIKESYQYIESLDITADNREKFKLLSYLKHTEKSIKLNVCGEYWKIYFSYNGIAKIPMKVVYFDETFEVPISREVLDLGVYIQLVEINKEVDE